jgi:hypothetical protein
MIHMIHLLASDSAPAYAGPASRMRSAAVHPTPAASRPMSAPRRGHLDVMRFFWMFGGASIHRGELHQQQLRS